MALSKVLDSLAGRCTNIQYAIAKPLKINLHNFHHCINYLVIFFNQNLHVSDPDLLLCFIA